MMKKVGLVLTLALSVLLTGCATYSGMKDWWTLREANFREFQPGKSTAADVTAKLGTPFQKMRFAGLKEEVWDYLYPENSFIMLAWVFFDEQGVFKRYSAQLHPGIYSNPD